MSNLVFPNLLGLDIGVTRTPVYSTSIQTAKSGKELRASWWSYPRYKYNLVFNYLRAAPPMQELQTLFGFIQRHAGDFDSFLFVDPEDNTFTAMPFGVGDGADIAFQIQRTLVPDAALNAPASRQYWPQNGDGYEPIFEFSGSPSIFVDGVLKTAGTDYSIANGVVTFTAAPVSGAILTWTGSFFRRVRVDCSSDLEATRLLYQIWECQSLDLISVK